jgi:pimeloyl-ACP methyl ester carboxylesterase
MAVGQGRAMTLDDVGDAGGVPLLYVHGTPDSRLARPADDGPAARAGVRLLALDRPGYGGSDPLPVGRSSWTGPLARDVATVLDELGVERVALLAWSGGTLAALALAAALPTRVSALGIVAGLVPRQAYDDPAVRRAGAERLRTLELADTLPPDQLGEAVAPLLAPYPCDHALALEHQAEHRDPAGAHELASVAGGPDRMADALVEAVRHGLAGVAADVEAQARALDVDVPAVGCRTLLWYGSADAVTPAAFGEWYARVLPAATLEVVPGAAHYLLFTHWADILRTLAVAATA